MFRYANRLIAEFKSGLLPLKAGTSLRSFLSKKLHCGPMRISKKYVGEHRVGKQVFLRHDVRSPDEEDAARKELAEVTPPPCSPPSDAYQESRVVKSARDFLSISRSLRWLFIRAHRLLSTLSPVGAAFPKESGRRAEA